MEFLHCTGVFHHQMVLRFGRHLHGHKGIRSGVFEVAIFHGVLQIRVYNNQMSQLLIFGLIKNVLMQSGLWFMEV